MAAKDERHNDRFVMWGATYFSKLHGYRQLYATVTQFSDKGKENGEPGVGKIPARFAVIGIKYVFSVRCFFTKVSYFTTILRPFWMYTPEVSTLRLPAIRCPLMLYTGASADVAASVTLVMPVALVL